MLTTLPQPRGVPPGEARVGVRPRGRITDLELLKSLDSTPARRSRCQESMRRERPFPQPTTFIEPCLPRPAKQPPAGPGWVHEIKHDGFRIMARRAEGRVQLLTRKGTNFASRFPQIVAAVTVLPVRSCLIDGEAVVCDETAPHRYPQRAEALTGPKGVWPPSGTPRGCGRVLVGRPTADADPADVPGRRVKQ